GPAARMPAGSVGKMFFAALALQLVAQGRLGLDDRVQKHLGTEPWFGRLANGDRITVRMLFNHTSGLPGHSPRFMDGLVKEPARRRGRMDLIQSVLDRKPLFPAGERFSYSDLNYYLLALVTEQVTGKPAVGEIQARLLRPLGLRDTIPADRPDLPG